MSLAKQMFCIMTCGSSRVSDNGNKHKTPVKNKPRECNALAYNLPFFKHQHHLTPN